MPVWSAKSTAAPRRGFLFLPMMTSPHLSFTLWMWACSADWHSLHLPLLARATGYFTEFKGSLSENYVLEVLKNQFEVMPRYWSQVNPSYEVDFLIQRENDIFPIEVKSEANTESRSLKKYKEHFPSETKLRIRFSLDNLKLDDDLLNIPLFMADDADRLIGMGLRETAARQCRAVTGTISPIFTMNP